MNDDVLDAYQEIARAGFGDMLHDHERNRKYYVAIKKTIAHLKRSNGKVVVLDIGTGTGLLSMMAVECGADKVIACEMLKPMAECARNVIRDNGYEHKIKVVGKRSTSLTVGRGGTFDVDADDLPNVLVTEVFDTELIGEGALEIYRDAQMRLLTSDAMYVPALAEMFVQIVESPFVCKWNTPNDLYDLDGEILVRVPEDVASCCGIATVHDLQLSQIPFGSFNAITQPVKVLDFNWSENLIELNGATITSTTAVHSGRAQAVFIWWELAMDWERETTLSCAPFWAHPDFERLKAEKRVEYEQDLIPWRDHWMQSVYYLDNARFFEAGQNVNIFTVHDCYQMYFKLLDQSVENVAVESKKTRDSKYCTCQMHLNTSRTRIGQMNDHVRNKKLWKALQRTVTPDTVCLVIAYDLSAWPIAIAKMSDVKHVYVLCDDKMRGITQKYIDSNDVREKISVCETIDDVERVICESSHGPVNVIFSEASFSDALLPWDNNAKFLRTLRALTLDDARLYTPTVEILPAKSHVRAIALDLNDLHKIRARVGNCEGFVMDKFDEIYLKSIKISDSRVEPQPLWEYPGRALTSPFDLIAFDFIKMTVRAIQSEQFIDLHAANVTCRGVALWCEWFYNRELITSGPRTAPVLNKRVAWDFYARQGVYLMPNTRELTADARLRASVAVSDDPAVEIGWRFKIRRDDPMKSPGAVRMNDLVEFIQINRADLF